MADTQTIFDAFRRVVRALRLNSQEVKSRCGLSGAQLFVLQKIAPGEALSVNEIAALTHTDQSSVSVVIAKLVSKKLLIRQPAHDDRRKMLHRLTPAGISIAEESHGLVQNRLQQAIDSLSQEEKLAFSKLIHKIIADAELASEPATLFFEEEKKKKHDGTRRKPRSSKASS